MDNEGDKNTTFFHRVASTTRSNNLIKGLYAPNGEWITEIHLIKHILLNYFQNLYEANSITHTEIDEVIKNLAP